MISQPRSILVVDASPFGSSLVVLSVASVIRTAFPTVYLEVASSTGACELVEASSFADATVDLGISGSATHGFAAGLKRFVRLVRKTRSERFDLILDLSPRVETQIATRMIDARRIITPVRLPGSVEAFLRRGRSRTSGNHFEECRSALRQMGLDLQDRRLALSLPDEEHRKFEALLERSGSRGGEPIASLYGLGPANSAAWPGSSFAEIATRLFNNYSVRIVVLDEPGDEAFTDAVGNLVPARSVKLVSPRAVEVAAAISRSSLLITDDAGVAVLAESVGTPVLEVADEPPPPGISERHRVIWGGIRSRVSTEEVFEASVQMLQKARTSTLIER
jgi:ADP-heptose:LPS heptosyltransferase